MKVPLKNISYFTLAENKQERPRRTSEDVRLYFHTGEFITVKMDSLNDFKLKGKSENFGDCELNMNAFIGIEFNLYEEKKGDFIDLLDTF